MQHKRFLALALCLVMLVSLMPAAAFAEGEMADDEEIMEEIVAADEEVIDEDIPAADEAADEEIIPEEPAEEEIPEISEDEDEIASDEITADDEAIDEEEIPEEPSEGDCTDDCEYPWDNMTDAEFAEFVFSDENQAFIFEIIYGENADIRNSLLLRIDRVEDDQLYYELYSYLFANLISDESNTFSASPCTTTAQVTEKLNSWVSKLSGKYWNYYDRSVWNDKQTEVENNLKAIVNNGNLDKSNPTNAELGVTTTACTGKTYAEGCKSNYFGGGWQCYGFAWWIEYALFQSTYTMKSSDWYAYKGDALNSITLQPGDYVRMSGHSAVIMKTANGLLCAEAYGSSYCKINMTTGFNYNKYKTAESLLSAVIQDGGTVYRYKNVTNNSLSTVASGTCGENLTWTLDSNGKLTISGTGAMTIWSNLSYTPWYSYISQIKTISLAAGVTSIGAHAFEECPSLTSITISSSVTHIGDYSFQSCSNLASITIPDSVTSIGNYAFSSSGITSATIGKAVKTIGNYAFACCSELKSISIPNNTTSVGNHAFYKCTGLTSITIPDSVTSIGDYAFYECGITSAAIGKAVKTIGNSAFAYCAALTSISIPNNVTSLGEYAFSRCSSLSTVTIGNGIKTIENNTFDYCSKLKSVTIGNGVTSIGTEAFDSCSNLASITIPSGVTSIGGYAFGGCSSLTSITIPNGVTSIIGGTFSGCSSLKSVVLGDNVTTIYAIAFGACSSLTSITIPESVTSIGDYAFYKCSSLTDITIPRNVTSIGKQIFYACDSLKTINFRGNAPTIGDNAFYKVTATAYYPSGNSTWTSSVMQNYGGTISWKASGSDVVASGNCGDNLTWALDGNGKLTISGSGRMYDFDYYASTDTAEKKVLPWKDSCSSIKTISFPEGVTYIGTDAFRYCTALTTVYIPASVTEISYAAFTFCNSVTAFTVSAENSNYKSVDGVVFSKDGKILWFYPAGNSRSSYTVPSGTTELAGRALCSAANLKSISIPNTLTKIGNSSLLGCSSLTSVTIPSSVSVIGSTAFKNCSSLKTITFQGNAPSFNTTAFDTITATAYYPAGNSTWTSNVMQNYGGTITWKANGSNIVASGICGDNLTWTLDSNGLLTISGSGAMFDWTLKSNECSPWSSYRSSIKTVSISNGVTSIGNYAFSDCYDLTGVEIPSSVTSIGDWAFNFCNSLTSITIPNSVTSIGELAFFTLSLTAINVDSGNRSYKSINGVLFTYDGKTLIHYPAKKSGTAYTIPTGVTNIGNAAFFYCVKLTNITIPGSVTDIGECAFAFFESNVNTITFIGNAPSFKASCFRDLTATAYYPAGNSTWTSDKLQNYEGNITWAASGTAKATPVISGVANHADYMIVRWGKVEGAVSYTLAYREGTAAWQRVNVPLSMVDSAGNPRYDVKNTTQGAPYTFFVTANFSDGSTTRSENASQVRLVSPTVTVNRYGTTLESSGFKVSWNSVSGGSQYKIYYREKGTGSWTLYAMIPMSKNTFFCNIKASVTNANANMPNIVGGKTYEFAVLTAQSQANITSGFPTSPVSVTFTSTASASGYINRDGVNMRTGPGTGYAVMATLYKGTTCQILEELSSGWTKVVVNGSTGYVSSSYITKN